MALLRTACPLDCPDTCTLDVEVVDDRIVRVDAAPEGNPLTQGFICQKVKRHGERVHGPDRVLTPLVRTGPKGEGAFREAGWDEALTMVVDALERARSTHGPESVLPFTYNSSAGVLASGGLTDRLWRRFGALVAEHTICAASTSGAWRDTYGAMPSADPLDIVHARFILVWGANPTVSNTHLPPLINAARKAGAQLAVVDPRRTAIAARADLHLALRPGTDVAAALAIARHLNEQRLLDAAFLSEHVAGVDAYLEAADQWPLDRAAAVCDVPAADLARLAEEYATTRPAFLRMGWGQERNRNGGSACRAVLALPALCGHFGQPGSGVMGSLSKYSGLSLGAGDPDAPRDWPARRVVDMHRLGALLTTAELDPRVQVLFVQGANPAVTCPDHRAVVAGLGREDLFTVVHEQVLTDTARYADVVLPATTHFEADDLAKSYGSYRLERMPAVIPRVGESRTNDEVAAAIAERLGYPGDVFVVAPEAQLAAIGSGQTASRASRPPGTSIQFVDTFPTHTDGRIHLHVPDGELPLPSYRPLEAEHPLVLLTPASSRRINSIFGERDDEPVFGINPVDASARGIADGDTVCVANQYGSVEVTARLDASLRTGVCSMAKGSWCRSFRGGQPANVLTPATVNDLGRNACFNDATVEVVLRAAPSVAGNMAEGITA